MKTSFLLTGLVLISLGSFAQNWELGVKGGLNIAKVRIVNDDERSSKVGAHIGGFARTSLQENLDLQTEVSISFQGWEDANITYVNVPVLAKYNLVEQFQVFGGPFVGFLIGDADGRKNLLNNTEVGANVGAEFQVNELIGVGANYLVGLTNILDEPETNRKFRNRVFQVFVAYRLN